MGEVTLQSEGADTRTLRPTRFLTQVLRRVFVEPVIEGRLRDVGWPPGLRVAIIVAHLGLVVASLMVIFAEPLRQALPLVIVTDGVTIPRPAITVLAIMIALALTTFLLATTHGPRWLFVVGLVIGLPALLIMAMYALLTAADAPLTALPLALIIIAIGVLMGVFRRRRFGPWQFFVLYGLVLAMMLIVAADAAIRSVPLGYDILPGLLALQIGLLGPLASPLIFAAGTAPAEVSVNLALRTSSLLGRGYRRSITYTVMTAALLAIVGQAVWQVLSGSFDVLGRLVVLTTLVVMLGCAVTTLVMIALARGRWHSDEVAEVGASVGWPAGAVLIGAFVPLIAVLMVLMVLTLFIPSLGWSYTVLQHTWPIPVVRLAAAVAALVIGIISARRGHAVRGAVLGCSALSLTPLIITPLVDPAEGLAVNLAFAGLVVSVGLVARTIVLAVRRRLTETRAVGVLALSLLLLVVPHRQMLAEPLEFVLGPGVGLILFGMWWQLFTASEVGNTSSPRFPLTSRVLLLLTSMLLTVVVLAYNVLARVPAVGGLQDLVDLGDATLGVGILAAAVVGVMVDIGRDRLPS